MVFFFFFFFENTKYFKYTHMKRGEKVLKKLILVYIQKSLPFYITSNGLAQCMDNVVSCYMKSLYRMFKIF